MIRWFVVLKHGFVFQYGLEIHSWEKYTNSKFSSNLFVVTKGLFYSLT